MDLNQHESAGSTPENRADVDWEMNTEGHQCSVSSPQRFNTPASQTEGMDANFALRLFHQEKSDTSATFSSDVQSSDESCLPLFGQSGGINADSILGDLDEGEFIQAKRNRREILAKSQDVGGIDVNPVLPEYNTAFPLNHGGTEMSEDGQHKVGVLWNNGPSSAHPTRSDVKRSDDAACKPGTGPKSENAFLHHSENTSLITTSTRQVVDVRVGDTTIGEIRTESEASVTRDNNGAKSTQRKIQGGAAQTWPPQPNANSLLSKENDTPYRLFHHILPQEAIKVAENAEAGADSGKHSSSHAQNNVADGVSQWLPQKARSDTDELGWVSIEYQDAGANDFEQADSSSGSPIAHTISWAECYPDTPHIAEEAAKSTGLPGLQVFPVSVFFSCGTQDWDLLDAADVSQRNDVLETNIEKEIAPGAEFQDDGPWNEGVSDLCNECNESDVCTGLPLYYGSSAQAKNVPLSINILNCYGGRGASAGDKALEDNAKAGTAEQIDLKLIIKRMVID